VNTTATGGPLAHFKGELGGLAEKEIILPPTAKGLVLLSEAAWYFYVDVLDANSNLINRTAGRSCQYLIPLSRAARKLLIVNPDMYSFSLEYWIY
jgi:hypothetical protein